MQVREISVISHKILVVLNLFSAHKYKRERTGVNDRTTLPTYESFGQSKRLDSL